MKLKFKMNGTEPPNHNRFKILESITEKAPTKKNKRIRVDDIVPLPEVNNDEHIPRYLVASAIKISESVEVKPLSAYNVFQIEKGLNFITRDYLDVTEMRSGDLMIKASNLKAAQKFLKAKHIDIVPVKIEMHKTLNSVQGRIFSRKIINIPEDELIKSLEDQKIIDIRKFTKKEGDKIVATGAAVVTFDLIHRPNIIKLGWERVKVEEYISNPMRCTNCQKLGHTRNRCRNIELCRECAYIHPHDKCIRKFCVNCNTDSHTSYDSSCPTFIKHKSVNKIKADRRCTIREAWKIFNDNPILHTIKSFSNKPLTFSEVVRNNITQKPITTNIIVTKSKSTPEAITMKNNTNLTNVNSNNIINQSKIINNNKISKAVEHSSSNKNTNIVTANDDLATEQLMDEVIELDKEMSVEFGCNDTKESQQLSEKSLLNSPTNNSIENLNLSPCSSLYRKYPDLNAIITPTTLKKTKPRFNKANEE